MAFEYNDSNKETGVDVDLFIGDSSAIPVTNVSFTEEAETSEVQFNTSYTQDIAVTGVSYSGSFEIAGRNESLRERLWTERQNNVINEGTSSSTLPQYVSNLSFVAGGGKTYNFSNVLITSHSKDAPADDRVTESYDFSAEKLVVTDAT